MIYDRLSRSKSDGVRDSNYVSSDRLYAVMFVERLEKHYNTTVWGKLWLKHITRLRGCGAPPVTNWLTTTVNTTPFVYFIDRYNISTVEYIFNHIDKYLWNVGNSYLIHYSYHAHLVWHTLHPSASPNQLDRHDPPPLSPHPPAYFLNPFRLAVAAQSNNPSHIPNQNSHGRTHSFASSPITETKPKKKTCLAHLFLFLLLHLGLVPFPFHRQPSSWSSSSPRLSPLCSIRRVRRQLWFTPRYRQRVRHLLPSPQPLPLLPQMSSPTVPQSCTNPFVLVRLTLSVANALTLLPPLSSTSHSQTRPPYVSSGSTHSAPSVPARTVRRTSRLCSAVTLTRQTSTCCNVHVRPHQHGSSSIWQHCPSYITACMRRSWLLRAGVREMKRWHERFDTELRNVVRGTWHRWRIWGDWR